MVADIFRSWLLVSELSYCSFCGVPFVLLWLIMNLLVSTENEECLEFMGFVGSAEDVHAITYQWLKGIADIIYC